MPVLDGQPEVHYFDERFREEALAVQKTGTAPMSVTGVEPERVASKKTTKKATKKG